MESSHQGDGQPSSSASVNSQEQDFSKCPWNMRQESASVKPELQDEAWAEQWAAELGVKEEPQDEAWAAQWAAELWEEGVKEEPQDEAWAADWAAEIWEKDEKAWYAVKEEPQVEAGKNGGEVKEAPHDEVVKKKNPKTKHGLRTGLLRFGRRRRRKCAGGILVLHWLMFLSNLLTRV